MGVEADRLASERPAGGALRTTAVAVSIGVLETVFAVAFGALVFTGHLELYFLDDGVGLFLGAAALTLGVMAWRAGGRGIVGGLQGTGAALIAMVASNVVMHASTCDGISASAAR